MKPKISRLSKWYIYQRDHWDDPFSDYALAAALSNGDVDKPEWLIYKEIEGQIFDEANMDKCICLDDEDEWKRVMKWMNSSQSGPV